jgi:hypothetical protein
MNSQILAPQGDLDGLSQRTNNTSHAPFGQAVPDSNTRDQVVGNLSPKMSIKAFEKLHLKKGILEGEGAGRFLSKLTSILTSLPDNISSIQSGGGEGLNGFNNTNPQDMERLRNILNLRYCSFQYWR